ncbi:MAG: sensor domain-containing diguanylate cyclase [Chrysiogenales bacterium]|nr:MAG: sensor domain-containing diguanylate cyclase [Chrysiogenales bacterium]
MKGQDAIPAGRDQEMESLYRRVAELEQEGAGLRELNKALRDNEQKYRLIADHSGDCLWTMDLATLRFTYVSPSVMRLYGSTPEETMTQGIDEVMPPHSLEIAMRALEEEMALEATGADPRRTRTIEIEEYRHDRSIVWIENVLSFLRDEQQRPVAILGVSRDVTERRCLGEELRKLAVTDPLTGAFNRRHFMEELLREMGRSNRYAFPFSLIMLDIDHFKAVNDRFGHEMGDRVLEGLVELIRKRLRVSDILARWGGEEFLIMLVNTTLRQAVQLTEALLEGLRTRPFPDVGLLTASFGVTQYRDDESVDALLNRVDDLMYQAKRKGRARMVHDPIQGEDLATS